MIAIDSYDYITVIISNLYVCTYMIIMCVFQYNNFQYIVDLVVYYTYVRTQEIHIEGTELYYSLYNSVYLPHTEVDVPGIRRKYCGRLFSEVGQVAHGVSVKPTVASQFSSVYLSLTLAFSSVETNNY